MRQNLKSKLAALPKPKETEWEFELPEERSETKAIEVSVEDAAERDRLKKELEAAAERAEFARQTQVVQRFLPRPSLVDVDAMLRRAEEISDPVQREVEREMALLIANDVHKFGGGKVTGTVQPLKALSDDALSKARVELAREASSASEEQKTAFHAEFGTAWTNVHGSSRLPGLDGYEEDEIDEHQLMVEAFDNVQDKILEAAQQGNKIEKKLTVHFGGYQKRSGMLQQKIVDAFKALEKTRMELDASRTLQISEQAAINRRLESLREEVGFVSKREREAQELYRSRKEELDNLRDPVNGTR